MATKRRKKIVSKRIKRVKRKPKKLERKSSVKRVPSKIRKRRVTKKKSVRSKSRSKQRRSSVKVISRNKSVSVGRKNHEYRKSVLKLSLGKERLMIDDTIYSKVKLKDKIREFIKRPAVKKKFKIKEDSRGLIRVVFKDVHKHKRKLRKSEDKEYNVNKKHQIAVSTSLIKINSINDFVKSVDFLMDFLQPEIERYIKYTETVRKTSLELDYIELVKYENSAKKNQDRPKTKKRSKKVRSRGRRKS